MHSIFILDRLLEDGFTYPTPIEFVVQKATFKGGIEEGLTLSSTAYGSIFFIATGFHGLHVTGGLLAFLIVLIRVSKARRFTHEQATTAIVVSYYWHFVDVVWIALFSAIYLIK